MKTWKTSNDPDYAAKKARVEHLYAIADGEVIPEPGEPEVVFCMDEFGPLNLQPHPGRQWAERGGKGKDPDREPRRRRRRATYTRPHGVRHLFAAYDLAKDQLYGHIKPTQEPDRVPGVLPLPAHPLPARGADRDRLRQLQPAPDHQARTSGSATGPRRTTSRSPTRRPTAPG